VIAWFTTNLALASLAIGLVLVVRRPMARWCGAGSAYALWLIPALRLLMPPIVLFDRPLLSLPVPFAVVAGGAAPLPPVGGPEQWVPILLAVWAGGAVVFVVRHVYDYRVFLSRVSLSASLVGTPGRLPVLESAAVDGPVAVGLLDPRIVVPTDFTSRWSPAEQRLALEHERLHHARGDLWWAAAALLFLGANWFNPLAWCGHRAFRIDAELACDAAVVGRLSPAERRSYAHALLKSASFPGALAACPLTRADQLKRRLKMLNVHGAGRGRTLGGTAIVTALGAAALGLGVPVLAQSQDGAVEAAPSSFIMIKRQGEGPDIPADGVVSAQVFADCAGAESLTAKPSPRNGEADGVPNVRLVTCGKWGADPAKRLKRLEASRAAIAAKTELAEASRERVLAALDSEIAKLRAQ